MPEPRAGEPRLAALAEAELEARAVAAAIGRPAELLLGAAADEEVVTRSAERASLVHLATHGVLDEVDPLAKPGGARPAGRVGGWRRPLDTGRDPGGPARRRPGDALGLRHRPGPDLDDQRVASWVSKESAKSSPRFSKAPRATGTLTRLAPRWSSAAPAAVPESIAGLPGARRKSPSNGSRKSGSAVRSSVKPAGAAPLPCQRLWLPERSAGSPVGAT